MIIYSSINSSVKVLNLENRYLKQDIDIESSNLFRLTTDKDYQRLNLKLLTRSEDKSIVNSKLLFYENDEKGNDRKFTLKSKSGLITMDLDESQIGKDVYFKVECDEYNCNCNFEITAANIESFILVGSNLPHNFITNYKHTFIIKESSETQKIKENYENYNVNIEIKGSDNVISSLKGGKSDKISEYKHKINLQDLKNNEYKLIVSSKIDESITIHTDLKDRDNDQNNEEGSGNGHNIDDDDDDDDDKTYIIVIVIVVFVLAIITAAILYYLLVYKKKKNNLDDVLKTSFQEEKEDKGEEEDLI